MNLYEQILENNRVRKEKEDERIEELLSKSSTEQVEEIYRMLIKIEREIKNIEINLDI